mmetsp:Transcript_42596/g.99921  ORF Transcript_42596/g.99921 Transcript_42596/m.99921 type:complete len:246 (-) Transcript_42596:47-784(-)
MYRSPGYGQPLYNGLRQSQSSLPLPDNQQVLSYVASWTEFYFLTLCTRPNFDSSLLDVRTADGARQRFESWTVLKLLLYITVELLGFVLDFVLSAGFVLLNLIAPVIGIVGTVLMLHGAWYSVVKRQGECCPCCERPLPDGSVRHYGYVAWAVWLAMEPILLWAGPRLFTLAFGGWLKLLLYIPNFFLLVACIRLFHAPVTAPKSVSERVAEGFNSAMSSAKAAISPCCPCMVSTGATAEDEETL